MKLSTDESRVLVVDNEPAFVHLVQEVLGDASIPSIRALNGRDGLQMARTHKPSVLLLDVRMKDFDGIDVLKAVRRMKKPPNVIMISGHGTVEIAAQAMKLGAYDFLTKPLNLNQLANTVRDALLDAQEKDPFVQRTPGDHLSAPIIGQNARLLDALAVLDRAAKSDLSVLITGETGTGKELFARRLHAHSPRAKRKFLALNCGSMPESLVENELFGHEKGAFTGAFNAQVGLFESASGGTLFLDEVASLSPHAQTLLLRVVESGEIRRVGSANWLQTDVRLVAATPHPLGQFIQSGQFRDDLYYRLRGIEVVIPPLRERLDDLELLVDQFSNGNRDRFSDEVWKTFRGYSWPGNVRELKLMIERALVFAHDDKVKVEHLGLRSNSESQFEFRELVPLAEFNQKYILEVLERCGGNIKASAEILRVSRRTLYRRLDEYGMDINDLRDC